MSSTLCSCWVPVAGRSETRLGDGAAARAAAPAVASAHRPELQGEFTGPTGPAGPTGSGGSHGSAGRRRPQERGEAKGSLERAEVTAHGAAAPVAPGVERLTEAIAGLAVTLRSSPGSKACGSELAGRLASVWAMLAELDPAVSARLAGYQPPAHDHEDF
jgi:hypothetical protein